MEKSPKYYETAEVPQCIHAMNESMKILLVVRDPVDSYSQTVVDGQKLVSDPVSELRKVETFLGLRHYFTQKNFVFNKKIGFYCLPRRCIGKDKGVKHPTLDPLVEAKLRKYFKPLNQRFYRIVGHDFGWR
ncbi:hypothetical protein NP493_1576g00046 [Ridgeia piscesae]|uniref:Sulfotransferase n=1 Tax=Ridgeia piscesae TaxID=27915 RepID=A0AAD9JYH9_RIDPI|nr:hypothetical protein NP493_1576g00046 [Ridgeia piscesae]